MNEIDLFIAGAVGGVSSAVLLITIGLAHIKWVYDQKLKMLQAQIIALQSQLGYEE